MTTNPSVLVVDDEQDNLDSFALALKRRLSESVQVRPWRPTRDDVPLERLFSDQVDPATVLVVTDYDLSTSVGGFFGPSFVGWCQANAIPVADFSRKHTASLPEKPNLFELRIPADDANGTAMAACLFQGFEVIRRTIEGTNEHRAPDQPIAATFAAVLGVPTLEAELSPFVRDLGAANSALFESFAHPTAEHRDSHELKRRIPAYILGHVLWNAVLRYPGVLLCRAALCAYLGTAEHEADALSELFSAAKYTGPFASSGQWFWRHEVDASISRHSEDVDDETFLSFDRYNKTVASAALGRPLADHDCSRCKGSRGGFWCPFTSRAVCDRSDCSTPETGWIPAGAYLARVERDFHDEWAPIL